MKLRGVQVGEAVSRLLYSSRLAEVAWKKLSGVSLVLSGIRHVCGDVHQTRDRWIRPRFGNYRPSVAVSDKNAGSILLGKDALRCGDIILERGLRLLNDGDVVAIFDKNLVNAFPAKAICPVAMHEYDVFDGRCQSRCSGQAKGEKGGDRHRTVKGKDNGGCQLRVCGGHLLHNCILKFRFA